MPVLLQALFGSCASATSWFCPSVLDAFLDAPGYALDDQPNPIAQPALAEFLAKEH